MFLKWVSQVNLFSSEAQCTWGQNPAHLCFLLIFRSGAFEEHVEAVGDVRVSVCESDWAAGWGNHAGPAVFGGERRGAMRTFKGLQQAAAGAQDASFTPPRYSMAARTGCKNTYWVLHLLGSLHRKQWQTEYEEKLSMLTWNIASESCWRGKSLVYYFPDVSIGDKKLSAILGELIWEEMSHTIIHECLVHSIPTNSSQLEKYNTVWT